MRRTHSTQSETDSCGYVTFCFDIVYVSTEHYNAMCGGTERAIPLYAMHT